MPHSYVAAICDSMHLLVEAASARISSSLSSGTQDPPLAPGRERKIYIVGAH